ncbi:hypothetical protein MPER_04409 [Moniliophthora perniciosa FA553]|nr:hypothetical protein MPER_04409 [Moniliophthora perniciosa FA553]
MPPEWAELPTDENLYVRANPNDEFPGLLRLDSHSRSMCGNFFDEQRPVLVKECTVYALVERKSRKIELQECPECPQSRKCFIGPDPRNLGLFNYNNSVLFTHELMDEYTSRFTSSETPFVAFVQSVGRIYAGRSCCFIGEDLFRSAWFAYASLQDMSGDMTCPECGSSPENVIWDGVTLAFGKRHLQDSLRPPTYVPEDGLLRHRVRYRKQQWVPDGHNKSPRKKLASWIRKWASTSRTEPWKQTVPERLQWEDPLSGDRGA